MEASSKASLIPLKLYSYLIFSKVLSSSSFEFKYLSSNIFSASVYQSLFVDLADAFIEYIHTLDADKIQQLDDNIKANGYGVKSLLEIENSYELLKIFQLFYYLNGRLLLTNDLIIIANGDVPERIVKVNLKLLYEMFKVRFARISFYSIYVCFRKIFWSQYFNTEKYN